MSALFTYACIEEAGGVGPTKIKAPFVKKTCDDPGDSDSVATAAGMSRKAIIMLPFIGCCILMIWNLIPLEEQAWVSEPMLSYRAVQLRSSSAETWEQEMVWKKQEILSRLKTFPPSPAASSSPTGDSCTGRRIYMHKLPSRFNQAILEQCHSFLPWFSMCEYFNNSGMGIPVAGKDGDDQAVLVPPGRWFQTNQYSLDFLFHQKLLHYPCLTDSPDEATLFYVPFYAGLDVLRYHYSNESLEKKNELGLELMRWLQQQQCWQRNSGRDHLLVMGKITWDFRRNNETMWGNTLLKMPEFGSPMKLLLERDPWEVNEIAVPHPTYFHPSSDSDISAWISRITSSKRRHLISFAGMPREPQHIRTRLIQECESSRKCERLSCAGNFCNSPEPTMKLFMTSEFCMQPPGDSATRRSVFDSLIAGCIPVLFDRDTAYFQYPWHLPEDSNSYSVYIPSEDVKANGVSVIKMVAGIPEEQKKRMRSKIINEIVPGLLYTEPGTKLVHYEDAFDITIKSLLSKVRSL